MYANTRFDCKVYRVILEQLLMVVYDVPDHDAVNCSQQESVYINSQFTDYFAGNATTAENCFYDVLLARVHPQDLAVIENSLNVARAARQTYCFECRLRKTDEDDFLWVMVEGKFFHGEQGCSWRHSGIIFDIDHLRRRTHQLQEDIGHYQDISEAITDYIYTVKLKDGKQLKTLHGVGCEKVTGYTSTELTANENLWIDMVHSHDRPQILRRADRMKNNALTSDDLQPLEHRITCKNGRVRWVSSLIVPHRNEHGELTAYSGVVRDITERRENEESSRQQRYLDEILLGAVPFMSILVDDTGDIIETNSAAQMMKFMPGGNIVVLLQRATADGNFDFEKMLPAIVRSGKRRQFDLSLQEKIYEVTCIPMPPDLCLLCMYDLTHRLKK